MNGLTLLLLVALVLGATGYALKNSPEGTRKP
jgi:hypothetical protein